MCATRAAGLLLYEWALQQYLIATFANDVRCVRGSTANFWRMRAWFIVGKRGARGAVNVMGRVFFPQ